MHPPLMQPQFQTLTLGDGYRLHARLFLPQNPHAALLYLHGIQSHGGWFQKSASLLASCGYAVLLPDRRGSGQNRQNRGDITNPNQWLEDLDQLAQTLRDRLRPIPLDLLGVSWGGKLAVWWTVRQRPEIRRLLLVAPGIIPKVDVNWYTKLAIAADLLRGGRHPFPIPLSDPAQFTDNPKAREFIRRDQRKLTHATARFLLASRKIDHQLRRASPGTLRPKTTIFLADRDRIIDNPRTANWLRNACAHPPHIHEFQNATHTLEFETDPENYFHHLRNWALNNTTIAPDTVCDDDHRKNTLPTGEHSVE